MPLFAAWRSNARIDFSCKEEKRADDFHLEGLPFDQSKVIVRYAQATVWFKTKELF